MLHLGIVNGANSILHHDKNQKASDKTTKKHWFFIVWGQDIRKNQKGNCERNSKSKREYRLTASTNL